MSGDDGRIGRGLRAIRIRRGLRQQDVARAADVDDSTVSRLEHGRLDHVTLATLRAVVSALDASLNLRLSWHGGDLDRLVNARHTSLHEAFVALLADFPEWVWAPEVTFSVYGERGVIDVLAWHPTRCALLIVELKTGIVDVSDILATADRRRRLARTIARERGWDPETISYWLVIEDGASNRRRVAGHRTLLRGAFPDDGRAMRSWLRDPSRAVSAMSFLSIPAGKRASGSHAGAKRVRTAGAAAATR
jgi:transcriptional regulator with XRE-family HTH domain